MVSGPDYDDKFTNPIAGKPNVAQGAILRLSGLVEEEADIAEAINSLRELGVNYHDLPRTERLSLWGAAQTLFKDNQSESTCEVLKAVGIEADPQNVGKFLIVTFPWSGSSKPVDALAQNFDLEHEIKASFSFLVDRDIEATLRREFGLGGVKTFTPDSGFEKAAQVFKEEIDPHLTDSQRVELDDAIKSAKEKIPYKSGSFITDPIGEIQARNPSKTLLMRTLEEKYPELFSSEMRRSLERIRTDNDELTRLPPKEFLPIKGINGTFDENTGDEMRRLHQVGVEMRRLQDSQTEALLKKLNYSILPKYKGEDPTKKD